MFPIEIICNINRHLPYRDSLLLSMTCKQYYSDEYMKNMRVNYTINKYSDINALALTSIIMNDIKMFKFLLDNSLINPNKKINNTLNYLNLAVNLCHYKIVKYLLEDNRLSSPPMIYIYDAILKHDELSLYKLTRTLLKSDSIYYNDPSIRYIVNIAVEFGYRKIFEISDPKILNSICKNNLTKIILKDRMDIARLIIKNKKYTIYDLFNIITTDGISKNKIQQLIDY